MFGVVDTWWLLQLLLVPCKAAKRLVGKSKFEGNEYEYHYQVTGLPRALPDTNGRRQYELNRCLTGAYTRTQLSDRLDRPAQSEDALVLHW